MPKVKLVPLDTNTGEDDDLTGGKSGVFTWFRHHRQRLELENSSHSTSSGDRTSRFLTHSLENVCTKLMAQF
jgi:hypothetical protein